MIHETIDLIGKRAKDKVTGFEGVISSACFDLYGCVQLAVSPSVDKDGKLKDAHWFDVSRIEITDHEKVIATPEFKSKENKPQAYTQGAAEKPAPRI